MHTAHDAASSHMALLSTMSHDILVMHAWFYTGHTSWHIDNHSDHSSGGDPHHGVMLAHLRVAAVGPITRLLKLDESDGAELGARLGEGRVLR